MVIRAQNLETRKAETVFEKHPTRLILRCELALFCRTGDVDRALERAGFEVVSVDFEPKCNPIHCDIL